MRVLLSTIGSRGDVQPLVGLALELRALGADVRLCVPPDFRASIEAVGFAMTPIGPELNTATAPGASGPLTPERLRQLAEESVATQFATIAGAAEGCDLIVGATALQLAAPSIAERMGIPYVFVVFCPIVLPSPHHAPPPVGGPPAPAGADNATLWAKDAERWNATWSAPLNRGRRALGLAPVEDVRSYVHTGNPWLAADPTLGPWPDRETWPVFQPGAWIASDPRPLSPELEAFLAAGDPPIYVGFGSMRTAPEVTAAILAAARANGRRAIIMRGWANLALQDDAADCIAIGEVNQQALFPRVAAVVHHGGAGTTTAAALAGTPQVILPHMYDQDYWAGRVTDLGIGTALPRGTPTADAFTAALAHALRAEVIVRARALALRIRRDGAATAVQSLVELAG